MKLKNTLWAAAALAATGAAAILLDALLLERYFFEVKEFDIGRSGSKNKYKLILIADLHLKKYLQPQYHKLAHKVNQLRPDMLLFAGDTLDSTGEAEPLEQFLKLLAHEVPKVAIPGNNDYKASPKVEALKRIFEKHNGCMLLNETEAFAIRGTKIWVTGLDDLLEGDSCFEEAVKGVGHTEHHLLLVHSPLQQQHARAALQRINQNRLPNEQLNISYIFAGHTHGGQVRLPGYVPMLPAKSGGYVNGWYNDSPPYLYVSKGFGTSTLPLRFFARSEITVFNYAV